MAKQLRRAEFFTRKCGFCYIEDKKMSTEVDVKTDFFAVNF